MAQMISLDRLDYGLNVRRELDEELVSSIKEHGVLVPLIIRVKNNRLVIKDGHLRYTAAVTAGLKEVPCDVEVEDNDLAKDVIEQLVINTTQRTLPQMDRAYAFQILRDDCGWSQQKIAEYFKISKSDVSLALSLLTAHPKLQEAVNQGKLLPSAVEPLLSLDLDLQGELADSAIHLKTVRKVDDLVKKEKSLHGMGDLRKKAKGVETVPAEADPMEITALTAIDEALESLNMASQVPIVNPELREKGRLKVRELVSMARKLQTQL